MKYFDISRSADKLVVSIVDHIDKFDPIAESNIHHANNQFQAIVLASIWANGGLGGQIDSEDIPGIIRFRDQLADGSWIQNSRPLYLDYDIDICEKYHFLHSDHLNTAVIWMDDDFTKEDITYITRSIFEELDKLAATIRGTKIPDVVFGGVAA